MKNSFIRTVRLLFAVTGFMAIGFMPIAANSQANYTSTVRGRVVDAATKAGIEGVTFSAAVNSASRISDWRSIKTDKDGYFTIVNDMGAVSGSVPGYTIIAQASGYSVETITLPTVEEGLTTLDDTVMTRGESNKVVGKITFPVTKAKPTDNIRSYISVFGEYVYKVVEADPSGNYSITDLPKGNYSFSYWENSSNYVDGRGPGAIGYPIFTRPITFTVTGGKTETIDLAKATFEFNFVDENGVTYTNQRNSAYESANIIETNSNTMIFGQAMRTGTRASDQPLVKKYSRTILFSPNRVGDEAIRSATSFSMLHTYYDNQGSLNNPRNLFFSGVSSPVQLIADKSYTVPIALKRAPKNVVYGKATDSTGRPLAGVVVTSEDEGLKTVTDLNGDYSLTIPYGTYDASEVKLKARLTTSPAKYPVYIKPDAFNRGDLSNSGGARSIFGDNRQVTINFIGDNKKTKIDLVMDPFSNRARDNYTLLVNVYRDGSADKPARLGGTTIRLTDATGKTVRSLANRPAAPVRLANLTPGTYTLTVSRTGYQTVTHKVLVGGSDPAFISTFMVKN